MHILSVFLIKNGEMRQCDEVDTQRSTQHYLTFIILLQNNIRMEEMSVKKPTGIHCLFSSKLKHFWRKKSSVCKELKKKNNLHFIIFLLKIIKKIIHRCLNIKCKLYLIEYCTTTFIQIKHHFAIFVCTFSS